MVAEHTANFVGQQATVYSWADVIQKMTVSGSSASTQFRFDDNTVNSFCSRPVKFSQTCSCSRCQNIHGNNVTNPRYDLQRYLQFDFLSELTDTIVPVWPFF